MPKLDYTLIAILSAFLGAIANILARTLLKNIRSKDFIGINFLTMGITLLVISPLFYHFEATPRTILLLVAISLIDTLANYFYFKTFENTEASIATPILSLSPAFTFILSWIFLNDVVSARTYILSILIILLIVFFSVDFKNWHGFKKSTLIPALLSAILFGSSAIPAKYLLSTMHAVNSPTLYMFRAGIIALFSLLLFKFNIKEITFSRYRVIFIRGLFVIGQWLLLYYALFLGSAGVTSTLVNITPVFVFILAIFVLREKPTWKKVIASIIVIWFSLAIR